MLVHNTNVATLHQSFKGVLPGYRSSTVGAPSFCTDITPKHAEGTITLIRPWCLFREDYPKVSLVSIDTEISLEDGSRLEHENFKVQRRPLYRCRSHCIVSCDATFRAGARVIFIPWLRVSWIQNATAVNLLAGDDSVPRHREWCPRHQSLCQVYQIAPNHRIRSTATVRVIYMYYDLNRLP